MALNFSDEDARQMRDLQSALSALLLKANENHVEAAIAVFALVRCARTLLDLYPETPREALLEVIVAFLSHADVVPGNDNIIQLFH